MKEIIIIGSGIGGLVAGNLLAKKGHKVTIFESHSMPGGYTAGFWRKGCYFESGTLGFESYASVLKAMRDIGVEDRLEFIKLGMRVVSEDFDGKPGDFEEFKRIIYSAYPSEKEKLDKVFAELGSIISVFMGDSDFIIPGISSGAEAIKSILPMIPKLPKIMKLTGKYGKMTASEFAGGYFEKDSKLYNLFSGFGYPDMSAIFVGTAIAGVFNEVWTVREGMQAWADVLAENFRILGGELKLCSYVDSIITKDGEAVGVSCKGIEYKADHVISAGDYKKTFLKLLDDKSLVPQPLIKKIEGAPVSEAFFTVYLGLDMNNEELARHMKAYHVYHMDRKPGCSIYDSNDSEYFNKAAYFLHSPSMINDKHAPDGKSSLMLQVRVPHRWMGNWGSGDREAYRRLKENAMNTVISRAAEVIPGLLDSIEYKDAATPLTYERFTHNTDGASCAWSWNPRKAFFKDAIGVTVKTPVRNLYIGSCWAMQV
ncbi:MAG: phytoene desaturase family protein, partial [Pseudomonadota bacterium]